MLKIIFHPPRLLLVCLNSDLTINNLRIVYEEPSHISDNDRVKVVFFKENLSTGWDFPQAETMMSFRRATDAIYTAQLLGRMIRTPLQCHISVDKTLNDVRLYLPHFDKETAQNVVDELQRAESGVMPADIISEIEGESTFYTLNVNVEPPVNIQPPAPVALNNNTAVNVVSAAEQSISPPITEEILTPETKSARNSLASFTEKISGIKSNFNRAEIVKAINQMGLLTYKVCSVKINNYSYR